MGIVGVAVRTSAAAYLLIVTTLVVIGLFRQDRKQCVSLMMISLLLSLPYFMGYWFNVLQFNNPIYPLHFSFMDHFPTMEYIPKWDIDNQRALLNIDLNSSFLEFLYVSAYASFGFGRQLFDSFQGIIHPVDKGNSIMWANPILVCLFGVIVLAREHRNLAYLLTVYFSLYYLWFSNVQYTRLFVAPTALGIVCYVCSIEHTYKYALNNFLKKLLTTYLAIVVPTFLVYHTLYNVIRMPNTAMTIFSQEARYRSNMNYYDFMREGLGISYDRFPLTFENVQAVDGFMENHKTATVGTSIAGPIHMFFKYGRFGGSPLDYDCFIGDESDTELTSEMLVNLEFRGYNMWCKDIGDGG